MYNVDNINIWEGYFVRKSIFITTVLAAVLCLSGCSNNLPSGSSEIISSEIVSSGEVSITQATNPDKNNAEFEKKCNDIMDLFLAYSQSSDFDVKLTAPNVNYQDDEHSLSKIYVASDTSDSEEDRVLIGFLDIYSEVEYQYFQILKRYIEFISENAIDISGGEQYFIYVNATSVGNMDIGINCNTYGASISYGDRHIKAAYSNRLKNMELFEDSNETIALTGLIKFEDLPNGTVSYDITAAYNNDKVIAHKWYSLDNGSDKVFVTYIDDGTYANITDDELLYYAYNAVVDKQNELKSWNYFYFAYKSGEPIGYISYYNAYTSQYSSAYASWYGEYEHLNSAPANEYYLNQLNGE